MAFKILVVDDDERQRLAYRHLFSEGHTTILTELQTFFEDGQNQPEGAEDDYEFDVIEASQGQVRGKKPLNRFNNVARRKSRSAWPLSTCGCHRV